jgi:hypothetical protein
MYPTPRGGQGKSTSGSLFPPRPIGHFYAGLRRSRISAGYAARPGLFALSYNLANFLQQLVLPKAVRAWMLTTLREKPIKIGTKLVRHARSVIFQPAEVAVPRALFAALLRRVGQMRMACAWG